MSWTTPTTRATGDLITASIWNTDLVDDLQWLHDTLPTIAHGKSTSSVTTSGTTFAAGADLLGTALSFAADGTSDYVVAFHIPEVSGLAGGLAYAHLNLGGADGGRIALHDINSTSGIGYQEMNGQGLISAPSAGSHTANVRMISPGGGTLTCLAGAGGAGTELPILVTVSRLA